MKNFILTIAVVFATVISVQASNVGDGILSLINNETINMNLENKGQKSLFTSYKFDKEDNSISLEFESEVEMIQLYNEDGDLEMMFPVSSNKVNLGLSLFEAGSYKMGFMIDGESKIQFASISIKQL